MLLVYLKSYRRTVTNRKWQTFDRIVELSRIVSDKPLIVYIFYTKITVFFGHDELTHAVTETC